jgi:hypothetical protein
MLQASALKQTKSSQQLDHQEKCVVEAVQGDFNQI